MLYRFKVPERLGIRKPLFLPPSSAHSVGPRGSRSWLLGEPALQELPGEAEEGLSQEAGLSSLPFPPSLPSRAPACQGGTRMGSILEKAGGPEWVNVSRRRNAHNSVFSAALSALLRHPKRHFLRKGCAPSMDRLLQKLSQGNGRCTVGSRAACGRIPSPGLATEGGSTLPKASLGLHLPLLSGVQKAAAAPRPPPPCAGHQPPASRNPESDDTHAGRVLSASPGCQKAAEECNCALPEPTIHNLSALCDLSSLAPEASRPSARRAAIIRGMRGATAAAAASWAALRRGPARFSSVDLGKTFTPCAACQAKVTG